MIKPKKLQAGDRVACVSLSWGGPATFPHRYEAGKRQMQEALGLEPVEMPHTLADAGWLHRHPEARAEDLMAAFADSSIQGIIATIGGEDSIRLLPYLDFDVISQNPKVFMGYSDTTVSHFACFRAGLVSFFGPAIMAGFAENGGLLPYLVNSVRRTLFSTEPVGVVEPNSDGWTVEFLDWAKPENQDQKRKLNPSTPWRYLQGSGSVEGPLLGGTFEVLEFLRGTSLWPDVEAWDGALLFLETSEEAPPPNAVTRTLRVYAAMGILERLGGILLGRPGGNVPPDEVAGYDQAVLQVVKEEQELTDLPVVTQMDFGHTDPFFVLPYGITARIDCDRQEFSLVESAVVD